MKNRSKGPAATCVMEALPGRVMMSAAPVGPSEHTTPWYDHANKILWLTVYNDHATIDLGNKNSVVRDWWIDGKGKRRCWTGILPDNWALFFAEGNDSGKWTSGNCPLQMRRTIYGDGGGGNDVLDASEVKINGEAYFAGGQGNDNIRGARSRTVITLGAGNNRATAFSSKTTIYSEFFQNDPANAQYEQRSHVYSGWSTVKVFVNTLTQVHGPATIIPYV